MTKKYECYDCGDITPRAGFCEKCIEKLNIDKPFGNDRNPSYQLGIGICIIAGLLRRGNDDIMAPLALKWLQENDSMENYTDLKVKKCKCQE